MSYAYWTYGSSNQCFIDPLYFMVYGASIKLVAFTFSGPLPWYPFLWWINLVLEGSFIFFFTTSSCCEVKPMIMVTWMTVEYDSHYTTTAHIIRVPTFAFFYQFVW